MVLNYQSNIERIYIKLGSNCNLHCKYCHSEKILKEFNPNILPILKELNPKQISFGGGEPLLYWDTIKTIVEYIGSSTTYKIVTNGTLFTDEIINFCNKYNFLIYISIDGFNSMRDNSVPIKWNLISRLNFSGTAVTFYKENSNLEKTLKYLSRIKQKYLTIFPNKFTSFPNFIHSTEKTGILSDKKLADSYIEQISIILEECFIHYKSKNKILVFMKRCFKSFYLHKDIIGIRCCNNNYIAILADGTIVSCPYTLNKIGNILKLNEINWKNIEQTHIKESCKTCDLFDICGNYCWVNITDDECYIMKKMNSVFKNLMDKYNITYEELENKIRGT